jgi:carbonic anhydrase
MMNGFLRKFAGALAVSTAPLAVAAEGVHWGYEGQEAPEYWGKLAPDFAECAKGKNQSPINVENAAKAQLPALHFDYTSGVAAFTNNGHTVQADFEPGFFLTVGSRKFHLVQMHFHVPSENHHQWQTIRNGGTSGASICRRCACRGCCDV